MKQELATGRLLLRRIESGDKSRIYEGLSHEHVIRFYGVSYPTLEATQQQMDWFETLEREGNGIWWAVCSEDNSIFYGAGGLNSLSEAHRKAEIGFWLLPEFWGKGLMYEAMPLILEYGFNILNLHRIEGFVETENQNCKKAIEKIGFKLEGTMRDCEIKHGRYISLDVYALLRNDYNAGAVSSER
jgi:ribosomal-protein-alanine N-acetyltransferase